MLKFGLVEQDGLLLTEAPVVFVLPNSQTFDVLFFDTKFVVGVNIFKIYPIIMKKSFIDLIIKIKIKFVFICHSRKK